MKAELRSLDLNSHIGLSEYRPENLQCFGFWLTASIGPDSSAGADLFQILVCNQEWLEKERRSNRTGLDRHVLIEGGYNLDLIRSTVRELVENCQGNTWLSEIVEQLSRFGLWEYEGYES